MKIGVCKECLHDVPIYELTQIPGYDVWECYWCGYPNAMDDFWGVFDKETTELKGLINAEYS